MLVQDFPGFNPSGFVSVITCLRLCIICWTSSSLRTSMVEASSSSSPINPGGSSTDQVKDEALLLNRRKVAPPSKTSVGSKHVLVYMVDGPSSFDITATLRE